jgi:hypothetical protein
MRLFLIIAISILTLAFACKTKPAASSVSNKTLGTVSHKYKSAGCNTIIIIEKEKDRLVLIPAQPLPNEFDKDGMKIYFDYNMLRIPSPVGCGEGIPATIRNISKK